MQDMISFIKYKMLFKLFLSYFQCDMELLHVWIVSMQRSAKEIFTYTI